MNQADKIKESITLNNYLTRDQIEEIIDLSIELNPYKGKGEYEGKISMKLLRDALYTQGHDISNVFGFDGNAVMPKGTYELIEEVDLGLPIGHCENLGCGHPIRFEEHIRHKESGKKFIVGNVCVEKLLGEHDLISIANTLLAKISRKIDRLNKAKHIEEILGDLPEVLKRADPECLFTQHERNFFRDVKEAKSNLTIKEAQDLKFNKWTGQAIVDLINAVKVEQEKNNMNKEAKKDDIKRWNDFLKYKYWEVKRSNRDTNFISNCMDDLKVHDEISLHRREKLQSEKDTYDRIMDADPELLVPIDDREHRLVIARVLNHLQNCNSYFHTSLLISANRYGKLTDKQIAAVINIPCKKRQKRLF